MSKSCFIPTTHTEPYNTMFNIRLALVILLLLLLFSLCILWDFVAEQDRTTKLYFSKFQLDFKTTNEELDLIKNGVESIRNEIGELRKQNKSPKVVKDFKKRNKDLPKWIEQFLAPHWSEFKPWRGVFVFFVTYRYAYLRKCLESIALASEDIDKSSVCVFALDRTPLTTDREVNQTLEVVRNVTFCRVVVWEVEKEANKIHKETNFALRLKKHWWFVLESVFNATVTGKVVYTCCKNQGLSFFDVCELVLNKVKYR